MLKFRSLANELTCSIDADKACRLDSLSSGDTRQCFKFLSLLSNSSPIPAVTQWNHREASCNASIANLFNDYFCSVYKPAVTQRLGSATDTLTPNYTLNNNHNNDNNHNHNICLDDLTISVDGIENLLQSVMTQVHMDVTTFLRSSCVTVLVSYLPLRTTCFSTFCQWRSDLSSGRHRTSLLCFNLVLVD